MSSDWLVPKDAAGRAVARGIAYGPLPRQRLDVYAPEGRGPVRPALVYFHGGSWASGSRRAYDFVGRALAAQGFVVAIPDYRLYPEVRFPDFLEDCARAAAFAAARGIRAFGGDPVRLGLVGHSAGAYNAAMVALDRRWLDAAGAAGAVKAWVGLAGPYDFLPIDLPITRRTFGAAPDLAATQPINFVRPDAPPAFLAHGDGDRTVAPRHTATLAALLRAAEVDVVERRYAGVGISDRRRAGATVPPARARPRRDRRLPVQPARPLKRKSPASLRSGALRQVIGPEGRGASGRREIARRPPARSTTTLVDPLALDEVAETGLLHGRDVNEHVRAAIGRSDEASPFLGIEELDGTSSHNRPPVGHPLRGSKRAKESSCAFCIGIQRLSWGAPWGGQQGKAKISNARQYSGRAAQQQAPHGQQPCTRRLTGRDLEGERRGGGDRLLAAQDRHGGAAAAKATARSYIGWALA